MYWGSSNVYPIFGAELDKSRNLTYKDKTDYKPLIFLDQYQHGWERFGPDHSDMIKPFIEGAWMTKHNGKYYLQYADLGQNTMFMAMVLMLEIIRLVIYLCIL
jgi:hypothetical protein